MNPRLDEKIMEKIFNAAKNMPALIDFARELSVLAGSDPKDTETIEMVMKTVIYKFMLSGRVDYMFPDLSKDRN